MSIKLVTVDIGGTFLSDQKTYNREWSTAQYQQTKTQDTRFVVAGGNQYYQPIFFFPEIANEIAFVAENGGWVVSGGKGVFNGELPRDTFTTVVEHLLARPEAGITARGKSGTYTLKKYGDAMKTVAEVYYYRLEYIDNFSDLEDIFLKFGLNLSDELILQMQKALHEAIDDIMVPVHTGNDSIDLTTPSVHEANGLRQLQELWGVDDSEAVVFGNGSNDIEVLRRADFSFAMEDVGSVVVTAAKYRTGSNNREDVPDMIDKALKYEAPFKQ